MFELAPVPLWLEDYSGILALFEGWRAEGVLDLRAFLNADPGRIAQCSGAIRILAVNARTLALFGARDVDHLRANLGVVFAEAMLQSHLEELVQLWENGASFESSGVNHAIDGRRLDIQVRGRILPGHEADWTRVLVSTEDVTARETARRDLAASDAYAKGLFEHSPISLWVEDFSAVKTLLDDLRARGIRDFRTFTDVTPEFVSRCMSEIRVIDVNSHTLELFGGDSKDALLARLDEVFRDRMHGHFREQLVDLWNGKLFQVREVVNYALDGEELHLHMQFSVLPGHEEDLMATIRDLAGEHVDVVVEHRDISLDSPFEGDLVERMRAALLAEDPEAAILPYCLSGGTDNKALETLGVTGYGFAPLRLPADLPFAPMFHGIDERVPLESLEFGARVLWRLVEDC